MKKIIFINFGKWSSSHGKFFTMERIYQNGWKWTPFVKIKKRHKKESL